MWRVLVVLANKGGQRQIDLAGLTSIEVSTLSRIVTRLVRMGVVSRTRSPSSTREAMVRLTASPKATVSQIALLVLRIAAKYAEKKKPSGTKPKMLIPTSLQ